MKTNNFLGLPESSLKTLSWAIFLFTACLGVRIVRASDLALKVANTQLVTSNSADRLEALAKQLKEQAEVIRQKDKAYRELEAVYEQAEHSRTRSTELNKAIEAIEELPKVEGIESIKQEIIETESELLELSE